MESESHFRTGIERYYTPAQLDRVRAARIGIAGAGGLGSNLAMLLARSGIENFRIIDRDHVEPSNLNRQHFWPRHVGSAKVKALGQSLLELNPFMKLDLRQCDINAGNAASLLDGVQIWAEALDSGQAKAFFVEKALLCGCFVVAASGLCGIGGPQIGKRQIGNLTLVGDFESGLERARPYAPRVAQAAALMADCILERVLADER